jgi:hypothetical protein
MASSGRHTKPIDTFGAVFLALILTGLFVYMRFAFALPPLEQFYLPLYVKTSIAPSICSSGKCQMLLMSDRKGRAWYALNEDVAMGPTPQAYAKPIPLVLSDSARQRGMTYLYRSTPNVCQNSSLASYLKQQLYRGASIIDLLFAPSCNDSHVFNVKAKPWRSVGILANYLSESKSLEKYGFDNRRPQRITLPSWMQSVFDQKVSAEVTLSVEHSRSDIDVLDTFLRAREIPNHTVCCLHSGPLVQPRLGWLDGNNVDPSFRQRGVNDLDEYPGVIGN